MKLVDILAQQLKGWPGDKCRWVEYAADNGCIADMGVGYKDVHVDCSLLDHGARVKYVTRAEWQAAVDALRQESPALHLQHVGRSYRLPSIGTHVFICDPDEKLVYGRGEDGEVIAHVEDTAVVRMSFGLGCFEADVLRTFEQREAEERSLAIADMVEDVIHQSYVVTRAQAEIACARIYDAGYRKQPK